VVGTDPERLPTVAAGGAREAAMPPGAAVAPGAPAAPGAPVTTPTVTVYSTPDCVQCRMTLLALEKAGVGFTVVDAAADVAVRERLRALGYAAAPVVVVDQDPDDHWSGFRPDRIAALAPRPGAG